MQKEYFKTLFFPVILLTLLTGTLFTTSANAALEREPYLQSVSDTRMVMRWRTTSASNSRVSYGATLNNLNTNVDDTNSSTEHEVVITGLTPNTKYFYSVGTTTGTIEAGNDASHYFITAPAVGSSRSIRIWAIGDAGTGNNPSYIASDGKPYQIKVRNAYYNLDNVQTDVVLALGDNAYQNGTDLQYTNNFFNIYKDLFIHAPVWSTLGNHELNNINTNSSANYKKTFSFPKSAESGGAPSGTELYYSFDYGNIHFVCLDSFSSNNYQNQTMYDWLDNDLASTTQEWIIAYWHHPPYSLFSHNSDTDPYMSTLRDKANRILDKYGVDLQLSGHNHYYARTFLIHNHYGVASTYRTALHAVDPGNGRTDGDGAYNKASNPVGTVYVVAGSSGKVKASQAITHHPANFIETKNYASMVIDVQGNQMNVRMLREDGTTQDHFTILKAASIPLVNAGGNQNATTAVALNINATVTDDGLPVGHSLTYTWSKVNGPGSVTFGSANAVDTTASFSAAGSYVIQLAASDGSLTGTDSATITVSDPVTNQAPVVSAGSNQNTETGVTINLNGTVTDDGLPSSGTLTQTWSKVSGPGSATFADTSTVDTTVSFSAAGTYVLKLAASDGALTGSGQTTITVTAANQAPVVNAGANQTTETGVTINLNGTVTDDGLPSGSTLSYTWSKVSGPGTATFGNANAVDTSVTFSTAGSYVLRLTADDSILKTSADVTITVTDPSNQAPTVSAGTNQNAVTGATVNLNGTVSDDGQPNGTLTYAWSKISGPGTVTFGTANTVDTTVTFSAAGSYVLRLTADDSILKTSADVTVTLTDTAPANQAPTVNAGTNQNAVTGATVNLNGTVSDDGQPNGTLTQIWSKVSGPGTVTFGNANTVDTSVTFSAAGSYVLRLTAKDGGLTASANVTITVTDPTPANQVPPVDTGTNQSSSQTSKVSGGGAFNIGLLISFSIILLLRWLTHHGLSFRARPVRRKAQQTI